MGRCWSAWRWRRAAHFVSVGTWSAGPGSCGSPFLPNESVRENSRKIGYLCAAYPSAGSFDGDVVCATPVPKQMRDLLGRRTRRYTSDYACNRRGLEDGLHAIRAYLRRLPSEAPSLLEILHVVLS